MYFLYIACKYEPQHEKMSLMVFANKRLGSAGTSVQSVERQGCKTSG